MSHAELCPVCEGIGQVIIYPNENTTANVDYTVVCHGCDGLGWITVDDAPVVYPTPLWIPSYPQNPEDPWYPVYPLVTYSVY